MKNVLTKEFEFVKFPKSIPKKKKTMLDYMSLTRAKKQRYSPKKAGKKKKRTKIVRIKIIPYKTLFNKAVKVFQTHIRFRDKMCVIGRDIDEEKKRCWGVVTCGHLISRGKRVLIFSSRNSNGQCQGHNGLHRYYPEIYTDWWINHYGLDAYNSLVSASKVNYYKWTREELEKLIKKYEKRKR